MTNETLSAKGRALLDRTIGGTFDDQQACTRWLKANADHLLSAPALCSKRTKAMTDA